MVHRLLATRHGDLPLPAFLPDATLGVVRAVDARDLEEAGVRAVVMNVFHLMQKPGGSTIAALGGLHRMAAWRHPIITDSGGFQAYSLIRQNASRGRITDAGIRFQPEGTSRDFQLTPEKSVQLQLAFGADIVICLDDCTDIGQAPTEQEAAVTRTIAWAKRCKAEFERIGRQKSEGREAQKAIRRTGERENGRTGEQSENRAGEQANRRTGERENGAPVRNGASPLLFAVIQGGADLALRQRCAEALLEIGFDGFGFGGWPLDEKGALVADLLASTRALVPAHLPMHALGVGHPESVAACWRMGYQLFDSALPTRDARSGRLYSFTGDPASVDFRTATGWHRNLYIDDEKHIKADRPIYPGCDCATCARYSVGYLRHLHKCGDTLFYRLATIHNLRYMAKLMAGLGAQEASAE